MSRSHLLVNRLSEKADLQMNKPLRGTVATTTTRPAPLQILLYTLPVWGVSVALTLFMPMTGIITSIIIGCCLLILPFTARRGFCPNCQTPKTLPFSGFGNHCKGCGEELVLRDNELHQIEPRPTNSTPGPGRR